MDESLYEQAGIHVHYQEFEAPIYPQLYGEFIPYISSLDVLFNCEIEKSRQRLRNGQMANILALGAHFDDVELGCGVSLAKHSASGTGRFGKNYSNGLRPGIKIVL